MKGEPHAGTRDNGRDFSERDARGGLHDGSDNRSRLLTVQTTPRTPQPTIWMEQTLAMCRQPQLKNPT
jgi:hypothetical protein